jgi:aspartyl-tRNA(Asn)/glutamyl-tRNA(Gln) amidotransferase subunit C
MDDESPVDRREIERLARLARITLDDEETDGLASDLTAILAYLRKLAEVSEAGAEVAAPNAATLRDDRVEDSLPAQSGLAGAPQRIAGGFGVPRVIE